MSAGTIHTMWCTQVMGETISSVAAQTSRPSTTDDRRYAHAASKRPATAMTAIAGASTEAGTEPWWNRWSTLDRF